MLGRIVEAHSAEQSAGIITGIITGIIIGDFCPRYYIIHAENGK